MSDTPRTESQVLKHRWHVKEFGSSEDVEYSQVIAVDVRQIYQPTMRVESVVPAEFARELERELNSLRKRLESVT